MQSKILIKTKSLSTLDFTKFGPFRSVDPTVTFNILYLFTSSQLLSESYYLTLWFACICFNVCVFYICLSLLFIYISFYVCFLLPIISLFFALTIIMCMCGILSIILPSRYCSIIQLKQQIKYIDIQYCYFFIHLWWYIL